MESPIEVPQDRNELKTLVEKVKDWALMHGIAMRSKTNFSDSSLDVAPFVLIPTPFPRREFKRALQLQTSFNELFHRVAHCRDFLKKCLKETIQTDEFTGNLFKIYETVQDEGVNQVLIYPVNYFLA